MSDLLAAVDMIQGAVRRLEAIAELIGAADRLPDGHHEGLADLLSDIGERIRDALELIDLQSDTPHAPLRAQTTEAPTHE